MILMFQTKSTIPDTEILSLYSFPIRYHQLVRKKTPEVSVFELDLELYPGDPKIQSSEWKRID